MFDREFHIHFTLADVGKLLLLTPIVAAPFFLFVYLPWSSPNAPAWVQALGSVGAIVVAVWLAHSQARRDRLTRDAREYNYLMKAFSTAFFASQTAYVLASAVKADPGDSAALEIYLGQLKRSRDDHDKFSYADLANLTFADLWVVNSRGVHLIASEVEKLLMGKEVSLNGITLLAEELVAQVEQMQQALEQHSMHIDKSIWQRRGSK